jgi:hypothetical protein
MRSHISSELRQLVATRAENLCEYCLIHSDDLFSGGQVDHIISEKHHGPTTAENLAWACPACNRQKGSDVSSMVGSPANLIRLFNPRTDRWSEHFRLVGVRVEWQTPIGEATVRLLKLNGPERIEERETLKQNGKYPSPAARRRLRER